MRFPRATHLVIVFEDWHDTQRVHQVLAKRFGRYGLEVQEAKSRLLNFSRPIEKGQKPEVFDFLGSSHFWGKSRKGNRVVKRKTSGKKLRKAIKRVYLWCRENRTYAG